MAVRLDKTIRATIDKIVASYNRKITRYKKQGYIVPEKTSYIKIASLGSRKSINRELKNLSSFNKKSLNVVLINNKKVSSFDYENFKEKISISKRALRKRIKNIGKMEVNIAGKGAGFTYNDRFDLLYGNINNGLNHGRIRSDKLISNMRKYEKISTTTYKDYLKMSKNEKEAFMNLLDRAENPYINPKLREQFLDAMNDLGYAYGIDSEKLALIESKIKSLSNDEFDRVFSRDLAAQKIFDYYYLMKMQVGKNNLDNQSDAIDLFDTLYDNIDEIIKL